MLEKSNKLNYFYKELPYGDPNAARFEEGATNIAYYQMPCIELTYPYTVLTWIMVDFLTAYYLSDKDGYEANSSLFWQRAKTSALYQYEIRVNNSSQEYAQLICHNIIKTYKSIEKNGYNLAKPVPIAENPQQEMVAVKGAKRIAVLLSFGFDWVTVLEYDPNTFVKIAPEQDKITCVNHAKLIFKHLGDIPSVKVIKSRYKMYKHWKSNSGKEIILKKIQAIASKNDFLKNTLDIHIKYPNIISLVNELDPLTPNRVALIINQEIDLIIWLYRRNLCHIFIISEESLYAHLKELNNFTEIKFIKKNTIGLDDMCLANKIQEIWHPQQLSINIEHTVLSKEY